MGNSGSVHHMQPGLKELHSYYQDQPSECDGGDDFALPKGDPKIAQQRCSEGSANANKSISRISSSNRLKRITNTDELIAKNSHNKVLPSLSENLRLRSTTNGAILHSGGTISGRRESVILPPLERSRTFITENSEECVKNNAARLIMTRRSQTQLSIELKKVSRNDILHQNLPHKQFSSNLDLRPMINRNSENDPNLSVGNSSDSYQKLSKFKIKNKKRKAPPVPLDIPSIDRQNKELERKQRVFKTRAETSNLTANCSKQQSHHLKPSPNKISPIMIRSSYKSNLESPKEKSFGGVLLSSIAKSAEDISASANKRKSYHSAKTIAPKPVETTTTADSKIEISDFNKELVAATKFRLLTKNTTNNRDQNSRQREPNNKKPKRISPTRLLRPETQSKIPQLKKTFYFGMESTKQRSSATVADSSQQNNNLSSHNDEKLAKDECLTNKEPTKTYSSKNHDHVYSLNHKYDSETNDNGIQVKVRPTLPRRQLEIPRFSPVAAWRTLCEEQRKHLHHEPTTSNTSEMSSSSTIAIDTKNTFLVEDQIHRIYREPCPFYPDNKSGDSGISGDDGYIVEKPIKPRNLVQAQNDCSDELAQLDSSYLVDNEVKPAKVVGPFLTPWTPQQDLEEDSSSDGGDLALKLSESQSPTSAHVFSLSLPRENQLSVYGEKNKSDFRSLQKLKRTNSEDMNGHNCDSNQSMDLPGVDVCLGNYRSDNWLLSKTTTTAAVNTIQKNETFGHLLDSSNTRGSFYDLSVSIQPLSLGSLTTGKHVMYLPNRQSPEVRPTSDKFLSKQHSFDDSFNKNTQIAARNKRFSYQSSVRQIERRRLSAKLSKEADQKEALRKSELEAMRRVEEEFQRKRAYEKASIRQQLRLYSMDDDNFTSLPNLSGHHRADPDGAISSASESPELQMNGKRNFKYPNNNKVDIKTDSVMIFANS